MRRLLILLVRAYQRGISPFLGERCRFHPSCSSYCVTSIERHGCLTGLLLAAIRLTKCHPFHPGGVDFVPAGPGSGQGDDA